MDALDSWLESQEIAQPPSALYGAMAAELARLRKQPQWWRNPELLK